MPKWKIYYRSTAFAAERNPLEASHADPTQTFLGARHAFLPHGRGWKRNILFLIVFNIQTVNIQYSDINIQYSDFHIYLIFII